MAERAEETAIDLKILTMGKSKKQQKLRNTARSKEHNKELRIVITNPLEIKNKNQTFYDKFLQRFPILISGISLVLSGIVAYNNNRRSDYLDKTNFNIVQNFWQKKPSYTLYNESSKPLTLPPQPTYYMYIPAKLYWIFQDGYRMSTLILLPISYENIIAQTSTGKTIDEIETSVLKDNFYGKLGHRDLRSHVFGKPGDDISFELRVYPFLAIATYLEYSYKDHPDKIESDQFITTPFGKHALSVDRLLDLENYTRNIASFPENEIKVKEDENIYDSAFNYLVSELDHLLGNKQLTEIEKQKLMTFLG
ncbi:hypothetical protein, partial [Streptococcus pluranimalium]|uniref:hypothetical protein n=1 Tax=Streptococcus pluranimalium TaxID=82348 RepID=UPI003BF7A464